MGNQVEDGHAALNVHLERGHGPTWQGPTIEHGLGMWNARRHENPDQHQQPRLAEGSEPRRDWRLTRPRDGEKRCPMRVALENQTNVEQEREDNLELHHTCGA